MLTQKLFYNDTYLKKFTASVKEVKPLPNGNYAVVLDQTAFYPAGGGQPADNGNLNGQPVLDVYVDQDEIVHILAAPPTTPQVTGVIDWQRRFDHMQQHSAQHILSAVFLERLGAATIGFHLGATSSQIDLNLDTLTDRQIAEVEKLANSIVFANKPVYQHFVSPADLGKFPLRKQPEQSFNQIRLIEIADCDCCPCGGTHVAATGEIGLIKIRTWERKKNGLRLDFVAGFRALADYAAKNQAVLAIANRLSASPLAVSDAVANLLQKLASTEHQLTQVKRQLNQQIARQLFTAAAKVAGANLIVHIESNITPAELNDLAHLLSTQPKTVLLLAGVNAEKSRAHLLFARSADVDLDMSLLLKNMFSVISGKGGGTAQKAQGGTDNLTSLPDALEQVKVQIIEKLKNAS